MLSIDPLLSLPVGVRIVEGLISLVIPRLGDLQYGDWEYMFYSASFAPSVSDPDPYPDPH